MDQTLIVIILAMLAVGGLFYVFVYPYLSGEAAVEKRQAHYKQGKQKRSTERVVDQNKRRQQIVDSIKDVDGASKKKQTIEAKLLQSGLSWDMRKFIIFSVICGVVVGGDVLVMTDDRTNPFNLLVILGAFVGGGVGLPRWVLNFLIKRRIKKFLEEFPGAVDIIIRGVKAGLPLGQCLAIIASEAAEPVRSEFRRIIEAQAIGLSVGEAVERLPESMPLAEANFFAIVINLQQKSGGNLSEALGNLSRVLRDRKKMRQKIIAMSSEAKASAMIIAALPFLVAGLVYLTAPEYISMLFTHMSGRIVLGVSAFWMSCGVFVMKRLVNFDF